MTVQEILQAAYGRSTKNSGRVVANESTELLEVVNSSVRAAFAVGAEINETFYGDTEAVTFGGGVWLRPVGAENIFRIENGSNEEVVVVPYDDREAEVGRPAVYELGQSFYSAGNPLDPTSGVLTFFFSARPDDATLVGGDVDPRFPDAYRTLLAADLALYLAIKDGRTEEYDGLVAERNRWLQLYANFLEHATTNLVRRRARQRVVNNGAITRLSTLFVNPPRVAA